MIAHWLALLIIRYLPTYPGIKKEIGVLGICDNQASNQISGIRYYKGVTAGPKIF